MKNNILNLKIFYLIVIFIITLNNLNAEDILINAEKVDIKENGNSIYASGSIEITDGKDLEIIGDEAKYDKSKQVIEIYGNVVLSEKIKNYKAFGDKIIFNRNTNIISLSGNTIIQQFDKFSNIIFEIKSKKIIYDRGKEIVKSFDDTNIDYINRYSIYTKNILFDRNKNTFNSSDFTVIKDNFKNKFELSSFNFNIQSQLLKSDKITLIDKEKNKLEISKGFIDLNANELIGSDYKLTFNKSTFGNTENDPRIYGRYLNSDKNTTSMKKSTFTTCKNIEGKCPAWSLSANEVTHKKEKKIIEYKNAWLEIYDVPVAYFPYFYHPDPSVKRQSGFLFPQFQNSSNLGFSTQIPYYKVIDEDKDATVSPRFYTNNNIFVQTEYRQVFKNSKLVSDLSYNKKNNSNYHFFTSLIGDLEDSFYEMKIETVSDNNYLKKYQIQSPLINNYSTLNSSLLYEISDDDYNFSSSVNIINDLTKNNSDKYEYIIPNYQFNKETSLNNSIFDNLNFSSSGNFRKYNTNVDEADMVNDFVFSSVNQKQSSNLESEFKLLFRNVNTYGDLSNTYKENEDYKILGSTLLNLEYPLFKDRKNSKSFLIPMASLRYSPNNGLNLKDENKIINFEDLFSLDRIDNKSVEAGDSITLGVEYKKLLNTNEEKSKFGIAMNFRRNKDEDIPLSTSLGEKTSDLIGYSGINITENLSIDYNFSVENDFSGTNYSLVSTSFNSEKFKTSFEYLEKSNFVGDESYLTNFTELKLNKSNSLAFETTKNIDKDLTDYYNLIYEYKNDCLKASLIYNKQFYQDNNINSDKNIFFKISFLPFGNVSTQNINE